MESKEEREARYASIPWMEPPKGRAKLTKENFFDRFKPLTGVFMERGNPVTSTPVLEILNKGRQLMEQKDVDGFYQLMNGPEVDALTNDECRLLYKTRITEGRVPVIILLEYLEDLMDDEDNYDLLKEPIDD